MLGDFNLLHHLTEGGTITSTIFTGDSNLLRALGLKFREKKSLAKDNFNKISIEDPDRFYVERHIDDSSTYHFAVVCC